MLLDCFPKCEIHVSPTMDEIFSTNFHKQATLLILLMFASRVSKTWCIVVTSICISLTINESEHFVGNLDLWCSTNLSKFIVFSFIYTIFLLKKFLNLVGLPFLLLFLGFQAWSKSLRHFDGSCKLWHFLTVFFHLQLCLYSNQNSFPKILLNIGFIWVSPQLHQHY